MNYFKLLTVIIVVLLAGEAFSGDAVPGPVPEQSAPVPKIVTNKRTKIRVAEFKAENIAPGGRLLIGDSITESLGADSMPEGWIDRGVSGDSSFDVLGRISFHIAEKPAEIALFFGINDNTVGITGQTAGIYQLIIKTVRQALPQTKIYVISVLPTVGPLDSGLNVTVSRLNTEIKKVADAEGVAWVNVCDRFIKDGSVIPDYYQNPIHLNGTGNTVLRDALQTGFAATDAPSATAKNEPESSNSKPAADSASLPPPTTSPR